MAGRRYTTRIGANDSTTKPERGGGNTSRRLRAIGVSIDAYLAMLPVDHFALLQGLRKAIREVAPGVKESVRFRVPTFMLGVPLVGFSASSRHCSFFVMSPKVMEMFRAELQPFYAGPGILRFSPSHPLPLPLVKRIVAARLEEIGAT